MKICAVIFFCWTIILVSGNEQSTGESPIEPTTPAPATSSSTTTTTTTPKSTSTTQSSTSSTSTTPATPITTTPTNVTTLKPDTTTTPAPKPAPTPKIGKWTVKDSNTTSLIVTMAVKFNLTYPTTINNTMQWIEIVLPNDTAVANGTFIKDEQVMNITWSSKTNVTKNSMLLHFVKNGSDAYSLHHIELYVALSEFPLINATSPSVMFIHNQSEYRTELANSYRCAKLQKIPMTSGVSTASGVMEVSDFQFQAFKTDATSNFGYAQDCAYEVRDVVPIAVGCALMVLIVIVLIAYLVGRRRSQARGYLSM